MRQVPVGFGGWMLLAGLTCVGCAEAPPPVASSPTTTRVASTDPDAGGLLPLVEPPQLNPSPSGGEIRPIAAASEVGPATGLPGAHEAVYQVPAATIAEMERRNGSLFIGWPARNDALVITGDLMGYIEPCGCAGLENQKGGMSRRHTFLNQLRAAGWNVVPLDVGGQVKRFGRQQEIKFQAIAESLRTMDYRAIGWSAGDLRLSTGEVVAAISEPDGSPSRFVSANVGLFGSDSGLTPRWTIVPLGGVKVGVTSVLADREHAGLNNPELSLQPAVEALREVLPRLSAETERIVLLVYGDRAEAQKLAEAFPAVGVVVMAGHIDEPPLEPVTLNEGRTLLVQASHKGMYGVVLALNEEPGKAWRYQRVPFDARFADSPAMQQLKTSYQAQLQQLGWSGLGISAQPHPRGMTEGDLNGQFVGSVKCGSCHEKAFEVWSNSGHAHATETLARLQPARQVDPECISCHATGWSPQDHFPYRTGFLSLAGTPALVGNGCENCHGPGAGHVAAEEGSSPGGANPLRIGTQRDFYRQAMRVPLGDKQSNRCVVCHDLDNSPDFDLETYWLSIEHKDK